MKKILALVAIISLCFVGMATAETDIVIKQELLYTWEDLDAKNATTATAIKATAVEGWPTWVNMIVDGTVIDVGVAYEDETIKDGVVLVGKEFGTLGKYLPWLIFPFKDRIEISLHYVGIYLPDVLNKFDPEPCSGVGYLKGTFSF